MECARLDDCHGDEQAIAQQQRQSYLLVLCNMFLFHSHVLLRKTDEADLISAEEKL